MALIRLNQKNFTADVIVGLEESFTTTPEIIAISKQLESIRVKISSFLFDNFGTDNVQDVMKIFNKSDESLNKWLNFLNTDVPPLMTDVHNNIIKVNRTLCPNYAELEKNTLNQGKAK